MYVGTQNREGIRWRSVEAVERVEQEMVKTHE